MDAKKSTWRALKELRARFGTPRALKHATYRLINRAVYFDCFHIIVLDREDLKPLDPGKTRRLSTRIATLDDLKAMEGQGCWEINATKMEFFDQGDTCLLSYVDDNLAGYTWAHTRGCPELLPGLRLRVPPEYLYNYAGFTLPEYRGHGLQSFRHHALLGHRRWSDRRGLLGFVIHTNYSSRRGQGKSGFRKIGNVWLLGTKSNFHAFVGGTLRNMGIERLDCPSPAMMKEACP